MTNRRVSQESQTTEKPALRFCSHMVYSGLLRQNSDTRKTKRPREEMGTETGPESGQMVSKGEDTP